MTEAFTPQDHEAANLRGDILALCNEKSWLVIGAALAQVLAAIANTDLAMQDFPETVCGEAKRYQKSFIISALRTVQRQ